MKNKKQIFVSIIWGYPAHFPKLVLEENCLLHVLNVALEQDMEVYIIGKNNKKIIESDPNLDPRIKVIDYKNFFNYLFQIIKFSLKNSIFYVNSYEWQSFIVPFLARRTIFMAHTEPKRRSKIKQIVQNFVYKLFTIIRLNNQEEKDFQLEQGTPEKKLMIVPLVIAENVFKLEDMGERTDLVCFGNVTPKKDLITAINAFEIVKEYKPEIKIHIVGKVLDENFKRKVSESKYKNDIIFHGFMENDKVSKELNKHIIYINSSLDEGQCVAVYDAALCGCVLCLPKIMSFTGVFKDFALFHDTHDHQQLAKNIIYYLEHPDIV